VSSRTRVQTERRHGHGRMNAGHGLPRLRQEQWHLAGGEEEGDEPVELVGWQMAREQVATVAQGWVAHIMASPGGYTFGSLGASLV